MEGEYYSNCNFEDSTSKKIKISHGSGNLLQITSDRISDLPDSLLSQILSSLDTKDACKTGILSRRWKNVWIDVENLVFKYESEKYSREHAEKFISFVDHSLLHCARTNLKKFLLYTDSGDLFPNGCSFADDVVDRWLQFISKKNVECFELLISSFTYSPPEWFYHKASFVKLRILDWEIKILGQAVSWPSLKILSLEFVEIDNEQIAKILLGCPVLEDLSLLQPTNVTQLIIVSQSVRKLGVCREFDVRLDLYAPWLQELEIHSTSSSSVIPKLINVSSLITANIRLDQTMQNFDDEDEDEEDEDVLLRESLKLLESIHHIKELTLNHLFTQVLSLKSRVRGPSPLFMCKHLTVCFSTLKYDLPGIACFLRSSPNLENLIIKMEFSKCFFPSIFDQLLNMDNLLILPSGSSLRLKHVELIYFRNICFRKNLQTNAETFPEITLVEYLFKVAPLLGNFVISTQPEDCRTCSKKCASHYLSLLSSQFVRVCSDRDVGSEWQVRKKCSALEFCLL